MAETRTELFDLQQKAQKGTLGEWEDGYTMCGCPGCFEGPIIGLYGIEICDDCKKAGCAEMPTIGQAETECLVERCECGGNFDGGECYCDE